MDMNLTRRIARAGGNLSNGTTIEVGPGPGGLTRALLESGAPAILAVEVDPRAFNAVQELSAQQKISDAGNQRLFPVMADALQSNLVALCAERQLPPPFRIIANLPYNLSTALLVNWLKEIHQFESLTLMFQKEVADRLIAQPGSKAYGRLSVLTQWLCEVAPLFNIPATAFTPPPKVISTVVSLRPLAERLAVAEKPILERVTAAAFGQRRKMLRQSLKSLQPDPAPLLEFTGIDPTRRAETLSVEEFCALARAVAELDDSP